MLTIVSWLRQISSLHIPSSLHVHMQTGGYFVTACMLDMGAGQLLYLHGTRWWVHGMKSLPSNCPSWKPTSCLIGYGRRPNQRELELLPKSDLAFNAGEPWAEAHGFHSYLIVSVD